MNYKLQEQSYGDPNQVIFTRSSLGRNIAAFIFLLIGLPPLLLGSLSLMMKPDQISYGLAGFGAVFTGGGLIFLYFSWPSRFVFDNEAGALYVEEKGAKGAIRTPLPYDDIDGFQIRAYSSSSSNTGSSRSRPHYAVDLLKSDGAYWMLYSSMKQRKSQEILGELIARVDLDRSFSGAPVEQKPAGFRISEYGDHTEVRWKRPNNWGKLIIVLLIASGFGLGFYGYGHNMPAALYWIGAGFLGLIGVSALYNAIAGIGKSQVVKVSGHEVESYQTGLPIAGTTFKMRTHEVKSIQFNFSLQDTTQVIMFMRESELDMFDKLHEGTTDVSDILSFAMALIGINKLPMEGHTVGEMLYIENLLQNLIGERTGQTPD